MHIKTPMSGMSKRMNLKNLQLKFVLMDESDYVWAKDIILSNQLKELEKKGLLRKLSFIESSAGSHIKIKGKDFINFSL